MAPRELKKSSRQDISRARNKYVHFRRTTSNMFNCDPQQSNLSVQLKKFHSQYSNQWKIYLVKFWEVPISVQFSSFSCSFREKLTK